MQNNLSLNDGNTMPQLGFGVWRLDDDRTPEIVLAAIAAGYRHIDTAQAYGNERGVGEAVRRSGLERDALFVTSKQRTGHQGYDSTFRSFDETMKRLGIETLDLFLIHWPAPGHDRFVESWKAFVALKQQGRVHSIGVSNFLPVHIERLIGETGVVPAVNQIELNPHYQQRDLRSFHAEHGIVIESYSPLGGNGAGILAEKTIAEIAARHGRSPAQVILRWHIENGLVPLPKSSHPDRIAENMAIWDFALTDKDKAQIATLDRPDGKILPRPEEMNNLF